MLMSHSMAREVFMKIAIVKKMLLYVYVNVSAMLT
ncbi:hypothetical protein XM79_c20950 [Vibrio vulnificus]|nr:hypothetical protein VV93_v1c39860 [Vibrio vulnificus]OJI27356.1 hypothetical protein VV99796_02140 [Vibrio vulnificus]OJI40138.1 hypothetical protein VVDAL7940_00281 [Vibrio vulnificus]OJI49611.1 hypothetical protein VVS316_01533 [Vibrio vulnificus]OJI51128.1 hypothetical protein VVATL9824_00834 [Vibrio vulnificus]